MEEYKNDHSISITIGGLMNQLFARVRLQAQFRQIIEQFGPDQGLKIIEQALERELKVSPSTTGLS